LDLTPVDWIAVGVQIAQVVMTIGLVYFAGATIDEARKNRKKDTIERMLEKIYFPMLEILDRARNENGLRTMVRSWPVQIGDSEEPGNNWLYVLTSDEFEQIREMVDRFGYYLGQTELGRLKFDLEKYQPARSTADMELERAPWCRLSTGAFDEHWRFFKSRCEKLTSELEQLAGIKND
jgi:hypothetical protein